MNLKETYSSPLALTQQFRFCGNPLRCDFYKNCSFQCNYCFAKSHGGIDKFDKPIEIAKYEIVEKLFKRAFENDNETTNIVVELLRRKTPIHCGGMSDPFQPLEFKLHLTYRLIELSNKYGVPIVFSTKQCDLPQEYWDILDPKLQAFQISLISNDENWLKKYEPNTPTPTQRLDFMRKLKSKGFWVAMRVQPLIDLDQAFEVMNVAQNIVDYIIVEHLKIATNNSDQIELFKDKLKDYYKPKNSRMFERHTLDKIDDIMYLKSKITKCKIGIGDNDLHHLSDSNCCCGIDTIGGNFDNWLRYNFTYFVTSGCTLEEKEKLYVPKGNCSSCFMSDTIIKGVTQVKDYVDNYCNNNYNLMDTNKQLQDYYKNYFLNSENIRKFEKNQGNKKQLNIFDFLGEDNEN